MPVGLNRDAYGFAVRPQHLQRYREYANIYKVLSYFVFNYYSSSATLVLFVGKLCGRIKGCNVIGVSLLCKVEMLSRTDLDV